MVSFRVDLFFCAQNSEHMFCWEGGEFMRVYEIQPRNGRKIKLLIDISKENIDTSIDSILSVMEQIIIVEMYKNIVDNKECIFYKIDIATCYAGKTKTFSFSFSNKKENMVISEIWKLDASLRMEIECDILRSTL